MKGVSFHPAVQRDVNEALRYYRKESDPLAERYWQVLCEGIQRIRAEPGHHHFDESGYRRLNLKTFPFTVLFEELEDRVRVVVVRHNSRRPGYGARRKWN